MLGDRKGPEFRELPESLQTDLTSEGWGVDP